MRGITVPLQCSVIGICYWILSIACCPDAFADWSEGTENIMGTRIHVELWCDDPVRGEALVNAVMEGMRAVENQLSPYIETSELYRVNAQAWRQPVVISPNFFSLIEKSLYYSRVSDGAFDISFASVGHLYDYRHSQAPENDEIQRKLPAVDYRLIRLDYADTSISFGHPDLKIDLGGIAKGYAVDRSVRLLQEAGVESAIVTAGGDSRILGDRRGTPWMIGIKHPRKPEEYAVRLPLENSAISTSGDYERFYMDGEVRIHHIISPTSGKSADQVQSVSVLAPKAVDSDALSTTVFVLGVKKGLALINRMEGIDVIIIDREGKLHYSEGLLRATTAAD